MMIEFRPSRPEEIPKLRQLWKDCFGDSDGFLDLFYALAYAPERSIVITQKEAILGAAYWFDCSLDALQLAYVYAVAISPQAQGLGLGSALMEQLHSLLSCRGYDAAILVPGEETLRRFYSRLGYRTCSYRQSEVLLPPLEQITPSEYARLRREYLPENGVVQEKKNLAFLSALADFYRGETSIAALSREDGSCLELLGAPKVGSPIPYAMGKALSGQKLPEEIYFAFGFQ